MNDEKLEVLIEEAERNYIAYKVDEWKQQETRKLMTKKRIPREKAEQEVEGYDVPQFLSGGNT